MRGVRASGEQQWLPVTFEPDADGGATSEPVVLTGVAAVEAVAGESVGGARLVVYSSSVTPAGSGSLMTTPEASWLPPFDTLMM